MKARALLACGLTAACGGLDQPAATYPDPVTGYGVGYLEVRLVDPLPWSTVTYPVFNLTVSVDSQQGVTAVSVKAGNGQWEPLRQSGTFFWLQVTLLPGANDISLRAVDDRGQVAHLTTQLYYAGRDPTLRLHQPVEGSYAGNVITVDGVAQAVAPATIARVEVWVDGGARLEIPVDLDGGFVGSVVNSGAAAPELCVRVTDSEARTVMACKVLQTDAELPELSVLQPANGDVTAERLIAVTGMAVDNLAIARVEVQVNDAGWVTASGSDPFSAMVTLQRGPNLVQVRAVDIAGNQRLETAGVYWAQTTTLRVYGDDEGSLLTLTLDKASLAALVPPADADNIDMLYLDVRGLLVESLKAMRDYDLYGLDTSSWGPAEWSMQKILTMTPDTADLAGTSLANIMDLSEALGLPPAVVLADLADLGTTDPFLTIEETANGIFENIIAPHPGMVVDPADGVKKIPVTLGDALEDLVGLADTLGPAPPHPGILFEPSVSPVLLPNFQMTVTARSSLRQHDGIDLGTGKTYLFATEPGSELLEFDFLDPDWFSVAGVADEPEVDLNFLIVEHPSFVYAGTDQHANPEGAFYRGDCAVWGLDTWNVEYLVADMMYEAYHDRFADTGYSRTFSYDIGALTDAAVVTWLKGWVTIHTVASVGDPPPPQYLWDSVLELAQVRLHDGGLAEGDADLHLALTGVRVPLTAEQMVESTRPVLESQKALLAEVMVGDHSSYTSACDLFLKHGENGGLFLFFVHPDDVPGLAAHHANPGFFADAALANKLSSTASLGSGDDLHEKVAVSTAGGEVYFAQDLDGAVWQLTMQPLSAWGEAQIRVAPVGDWQ